MALELRLQHEPGLSECMQIPRVITKRLLTPKEAALYLGILERQLESHRHDGKNQDS